jgi:hypothetical protein
MDKGLRIFLGWTHQSDVGSGCRLPFMVYKELLDDWFAVPRINSCFDDWFAVPRINQTHQRSAAFLRSEHIAPNQNQASD